MPPELNQGSWNVWKIAKLVGILLAVFLFILSIKAIKETRYVGRDITGQSTISVSGHGEEIAIPDIATFTFSVIQNAKTLNEARTEATDIANKSIDALGKNDVAKNDIKTLSYNVNPKYEYMPQVCTVSSCRPSKEVLIGYEVNQTIEVKVRDISKVGALLDVVTGLGVTNVSGLQFSVDKKDDLQNKARTEAIKKARTQAEALADSLDVNIVRITGFQESNGGGYPTPMYYMKDIGGRAETASAPQIPVGEQKITSDVTIVYEIR